MRLLKSTCRVICASMYSQDFRNVLAIAHEEEMLKGFVYLGSEGEPPFGKSNTFVFSKTKGYVI